MGFVNQETVVRNGFALERLGHAGQVDNENISRIAEDTQKESRTMRIATIIAMVYLPANLVLVRHPNTFEYSAWEDTDKEILVFL